MSETKKRINKVLAEELSLALHKARAVMGDRFEECLAQYRADRVAFIAANGLTIGKTDDQIVYPQHTLNPQYYDALKALDEAYAKMHRHRESPADFVDATIQKEVNRKLARRPRNKKSEAGADINKVKIAEYLKRKGYIDSTDKAALVTLAAEHFDCSERTVKRAAKSGGLTARKKT